MKNKEVNILIVEDNESTRNLLKIMLEKEGYFVYAVENGEQALHLLDVMEPSLIICDIMTPVLDGLSFRHHLEDDPVLEKIPFFFLTALSKTQYKLKGLRLNPDDYITKPFDPQELLARIKSKLHRHDILDSGIELDVSTHLLSKRMVISLLRRELLRVTRYHRKLSLLALCGDELNDLADTLGEKLEHIIRQKIGRIISNNIRELDISGWLTTDTFLIIMPETNQDSCLLAAERLMKMFNEETFSDFELSFTWHMAILAAPLDGIEAEQLVRDSQKILAKARSLAKNNICFFSPDSDSNENNGCNDE